MTGNQNHDELSSRRKRFKTFDKGGVAPWSDLHHHLLYIVMMRLGVFDFFALSGVCKSWRSLTFSNRNKFMASKPPMLICPRDDNQYSNWYLEDFEGRRCKTIVPHLAGRTCFGLTCGYLVLFSRETRDFWLVNPITMHGLHFPNYPLYVGTDENGFGIKAILVFSPSISGWVLVVLHKPVSSYKRGKRKISFSIVGKRGWNNVSSTLPIIDIHVFKGKIYTLHIDCSLCELRLGPNQKRKWTTVLETENFPTSRRFPPELVSSGESLYMICLHSSFQKVMELNFGEMKWVWPEKTIREYAFFISMLNPSAAIKPESWVSHQTQYKTYDYSLDTHKSRRDLINYNRMWYFPHDCLNVNILDE